MNAAACWWRWRGDALLLALKVQPRASRNQVAGPAAERLRVRLTAPPVDGAANACLVDFMAECFDVPRRDVTLLAGASSRNKQVSVESPRRFPDWASEAERARPKR